MLNIKTTPNLYGITLMGDYDDLNDLYDSLSRYISLYNDNNDDYPYHEYEYLLSLNYDIRHCYQGDRNVGKDDRGNRYYSVEILYPLIFHYLISFENILMDEPQDFWLETEDESGEKWSERYTLIEANRDRAAIAYLTSLFWANLQQLFGKETIESVYYYYQNAEFPMTASLYCDVLIHCQLVNFEKMNEKEKKAFLLAALYETIETDDLADYPDEFHDSVKLFYDALAILNTDKTTRFPERDKFYQALDKYHDPSKPLYEDEFDKFLNNTYGVDPDPNEEEELNW